MVLRRTVVGDIDLRFDNMSKSNHQSQVDGVLLAHGIFVSIQLSRDVIGSYVKVFINGIVIQNR